MNNYNWDAQEIIPGVYLGSVFAANNIQELNKRNITCVLDLSGEIIKHKGIQYCCFKNINDSPNQPMIHLFPTALAFITYCNKNNYNIIINCYAGISRSSTIIAAYLIHYNNSTVKDAIGYLRTKRYKVNPNPGFILELEKFIYNDHHIIQDKIDKECYNFDNNLPVTEYKPLIN